MKIIGYLFKTEGQPFFVKLKDEFGNLLLVYGINPNDTAYKDGKETCGRRFHKLFIDPSFQTEKWFWAYYMPGLASTGAILYDFIHT